MLNTYTYTYACTCLRSSNAVPTPSTDPVLAIEVQRRRELLMQFYRKHDSSKLTMQAGSSGGVSGWEEMNEFARADWGSVNAILLKQYGDEAELGAGSSTSHD